MDTTKHIKLITSSEIIINRIRTLLAEKNIDSIIKNHRESARLAGFGALDNSVELFVLESDFKNAQEITNEFQKQTG